MRPVFLLAILSLLIPAMAEAQPRLMVGGGFSTPNGSITDIAEPGYHAQIALHVDIPTLPVGFRADGAVHRLASADPALARTEVLAGALSLVYTLPGVGLQPYLLGGLGSYRIDSGPLDMTEAVTDRGYHAGFGVVIGGLGFGAFAEIRYVQINGTTSTKLIPVTLGLRL